MRRRGRRTEGEEGRIRLSGGDGSIWIASVILVVTLLQTLYHIDVNNLIKLKSALRRNYGDHFEMRLMHHFIRCRVFR